MVRLGERPLTLKVRWERALKIPYGICPFLFRPKNVSNLRLSALPCSSSLRFGGEVVLMVTPLVPWPFSYKRDLSRASQTFMNKGK